MLGLFGEKTKCNLVVFSLLLSSYLVIHTSKNLPEKVVEETSADIEPVEGEVDVPKSIIMYECIEKYSDMYNIPKYIAYNVAYRETRYRGPFHWGYNPEQGSYAGALGPMQIMPSTGRSYYNKIMGYTDELTNERLKTDIETNVMLSMKILRRTFDKVGSWSVTCGKYNTGRPIINEYATYCSSNKDYKSKWVKH
jgi:soluble lytic murein transglycosylase-like protein